MHKAFHLFVLGFFASALLLTIPISESWGQCQSVTISGQDIGIVQPQVCAPVPITLNASYTFAFPVDPSKVQIRIEWNNAADEVETINATQVGTNKFEVSQSKTYEAGNTCAYEPTTYLVYDGQICVSTRQSQLFSAWSTDDANPGPVVMDPVIAEYCPSTPINQVFHDNTTFNCNIGIEPDKPNRLTRWVQFIYNTSPGGSGDLIRNAQVDGVQLTDINGNFLNEVVGTIGEIAPNADGPVHVSLPITAPQGSPVGSYIEVTMRNWNICNPYDDPNIPGPPSDPINGDNPPIETTSRILIVNPPSAEFTIGRSLTSVPHYMFCPGDAVFFRGPTFNSNYQYNWEFTGPSGFIRNETGRNISRNYFNTPGTYTAKLMVRDNNASGICISETTRDFEIIDSPVPDMEVAVDGTATTDLDFCERPGTPYEFSIENNTSPAGPNVEYTWRLRRNGSSMQTFETTDINDNFTFDLTQPGAYKVQLTAFDDDTKCANTTEIDINIANNPVADFEIVNATDLCVGREVQFSDLSGFATAPIFSDDEIASWTWYFDYDNNPALQSSNQNPTHSYLAIGTYKVRLEVTTKYGCVDSKEMEVIVNPVAAAQISVDNNAQCAPFSPVFTNQFANNQHTSVTVLKYRWIGYDESNNIVFDEEQLPDLVTNDFPTEFTHEFLYTRTDNQDQLYRVVMQAIAADENGDEGCVTTSNEITITVNPTASSGLTSDYGPFNSNCTDVEVNFQVDAATLALPFPKTYEWIVSDENGEVHRTSNDAANTHFQYTFTSQDSISIKTYTVTLATHSTSGSCIQPASQEIRLNPTPSSKFTSTLNWECEEVSLSLDANQKGLNPTNYYWTFYYHGTTDPVYYLNNPPLDDNFSLEFERGEADTVIDVTLRTRNFAGCESIGPTQTFTIPKKEDFIVAFDTLSTAPNCAPHEISFKNNSTVPAGTVFELRIQRGSMMPVTVPVTGDINDEFSYTFEDAGDYIVSLVGTNNTTSGCTQEAYINLTIHPSVKAMFEPDTDEICPGQPLYLNEKSQGTVISKVWTITNLGNGNMSQYYNDRLFHIFNDPGQYTIELMVQSAAGCTDVTTRTIEVDPRPEFTLIYNDTSCDQTFTFEVEITDPTMTISYVTWTWGDSQSEVTTDLENSHTYINKNGFTGPDQYTGSVTATATTGCTFTRTFTVNLLQDISANFSMDRSEGCAPLAVTFTDYSLGHDPALQQWSYREVSPSTGSWTTFAGTYHTFENTTSDTKEFEVRLQSTNADGCTDEIIKEVTVHPQVVADFDVDILDGCSPMEVRFTNNNIRNGVEYTWDWSDGPSEVTTTETEITHIFENTSYSLPKNYRVRLTATDVGTGCSVYTEKTITVRPSMSATLTPSVIEGCSPLYISIENSFNGIDFHEWEVINMSTGQVVPEYGANTPNYEHTLENFESDAILYRIVYTGTKNHPSGTMCTVTEVTEVLVYPDITASFTATPVLQNLPDAEVTLTNTTANKPNYTYLWDFGNGTTSTGTIDYGTYGKFTISLTVEDQFGDQCAKTVTQEIEILPTIPEIDFEYHPAEGCGPLTVQFISKAKYVEPGTLLWDFGDNSTSKSSETNPTYTYYEPGEYTVTLSGSNAIGITASETKSYIINVYDNPRANFRVRQRMPIYMPDSVIFINESRGAVSYIWDFGDGTTSTEFEPKHAYTKAGEYTIKLIAINDLGCADTLVRVSEIEIENQFEVKIPNVFTPNGDQNNDIFLPLIQGAVEYNLLIFNRWGELLFESNSPEVGWDGYYKGVMSPPDAYIYKLEVKFENGERTTKHGDVTLLR
jgi:gliding motility-associated-like protein